MKFVGSWKQKYLGINHNRMVYYIGYREKDIRRWGYLEDWCDGPLYEFGFGPIAFIWHHDD